MCQWAGAQRALPWELEAARGAVRAPGVRSAPLDPPRCKLRGWAGLLGYGTTRDASFLSPCPIDSYVENPFRARRSFRQDFGAASPRCRVRKFHVGESRPVILWLPGLSFCSSEEGRTNRQCTTPPFNLGPLPRRWVLFSTSLLIVAVMGLLFLAPLTGDLVAGPSMSSLRTGGGGHTNPFGADLRGAHLQDAFLSGTQRAATALLADNNPRWPAVVATVPVGSDPLDAAYDAATGQVFVTNLGSSNVSVINDATDKVVASVSVGSEPWAVTYDAAKGEVFVTNIESCNVSVISDTTDTVVAMVPFGSYCNSWGMTYNAATGQVFVTNEATGNVNVISDATDTMVATVPDGGDGADPWGAAYNAATGQVFVANYGSDDVRVISDTSDKVVATVPVGSGPELVADDAAKGEVFVTNTLSNNVSVISDTTDTVVATVPVGTEPWGVAYDAAKGEVFVTNCGLGYQNQFGQICDGVGSGNVSVINDTTDKVVAWVTVGFTAVGATYDAATDQVFVENYGSDDVSVISFTLPDYAVTFVTNPTSCGSITFNGTAYADSQAVTVAEGNYTVSAAACTGYTLQNLSGTGSVSVSSGKATVGGVGGIAATFSLNSSPSTAGFLGLPGNDGYYVLGGAAVAVVAAAAGTLLVRSRRHNQRRTSGSSGGAAPSSSQAEQLSQATAEAQVGLLTGGQCTACGQGIPQGAKFCHKCGEPLPPAGLP